jgi:NADPH:quinone reductase
VLNEFGPPERLIPAEVADPVPGPGEVLVDVEIAGITFVETQVRAGRAPNPAMLPRLPAILGNGVGGRVDGEPVVTTTGGSGGYAERVAVPAAGLIPVPAGVDLADAVALLADGRTALSLMRHAGVAPGETVLVAPAGGGVGTLLVQLARAAGARVVAAARGARKLSLTRSLGAAVAVDYGEPGWTERVGAVDLALDGVGGAIGHAAFERVRPGGRFYRFGMASGEFTDVSSRDDVAILGGGRLTPEEMRELTTAALAEAAAGRLRPVIGQTFPLDRAADAHAAIEARRTIGKTLLRVSGDGRELDRAGIQ